jgi:hydantoinase/carbamoylase family amidase
LLKYNDERFLKIFKNVGKIGWTENGMERPSYGEKYFEARDYLENEMKNAGMSTRIDSVGNLYGRYEGTDPHAGTIVAGSHLDAVPNGGRYDGALGIVAGLEAMHSIHEEKGTLKNPLEVLAFIAEEASLLGGTFGSRTITGLAPLKLSDEAARWSGLTVQNLIDARINPKKYRAYLELHIEQGPVLERKKISIGIPTGIVSIVRYKITLHGQANHAGTTPMSERHDAMRAAARLITDWYKWVDQRLAKANNFVCNIGVFGLMPNSPAVVPGEASFTLELRSLSDKIDAEITNAFKKQLDNFEEFAPTMDSIVTKPSVSLNEEVISAAERASAVCGLSCQRMPSGASHDAAAMAHFMPTGMIFVPSKDGISHNMKEYTSDADIINGLHVLGETVLQLADK